MTNRLSLSILAFAGLGLSGCGEFGEGMSRGIAMQLNSFLDAGAFKVLPDGRFTVDTAKIGDAVTTLTREIMTLQAEGSYAKAKAMIDTLGVVRPEVKRVLDRLTDVPVDIEPVFTTAESLSTF